MINKEIRKALLARLRITHQALSQRAKKIQELYGPMSTEDAKYVIAHQHGIDLSRYLSAESLDRIRSVLPRELPPPASRKAATPRKVAKASYPFVSSRDIQRSVEIGNVSFPQLFILENSIRNLIRARLRKFYGQDWWQKANIKNVRDRVQWVMDKEKRYPYRERRGSNPLLYANFDDLKQIILNERDHFLSEIVDFQWFQVEMEQVYMARNCLAHSVAISTDDAARIRLFYRGWARLMESAGH